MPHPPNSRPRTPPAPRRRWLRLGRSAGVLILCLLCTPLPALHVKVVETSEPARAAVLHLPMHNIRMRIELANKKIPLRLVIGQFHKAKLVDGNLLVITIPQEPAQVFRILSITFLE